MTGAAIDVVVGLARGDFTLDLAVSVRPGTVTALVGPTGAGKTLLINCLAGHDHPDRGRIVIGSLAVFDSDRRSRVPAARRPVAVVTAGARAPQRRQGADIPGVKDAPEGSVAAQVIARLQLAPLLAMPAATLAPWQWRQLALGGALVSGRPVILVDGLTEGLEPGPRDRLRAIAASLRGLGPTILYACHDVREAARVAEDAILLEDGRVAASGTVTALSQSPADHHHFADAGCVTEGRVCGKDLVSGLIELKVGSGIVRAAASAGIGQRLRIRLDPLQVTIAPADSAARTARDGMPGVVRSLMPHPSGDLDVGIACGDVLVWSRQPQAVAEALALRPGSPVRALATAAEVLGPSTDAPPVWRPRQGSNLQPSA